MSGKCTKTQLYSNNSKWNSTKLQSKYKTIVLILNR